MKVKIKSNLLYLVWPQLYITTLSEHHQYPTSFNNSEHLWLDEGTIKNEGKVKTSKRNIRLQLQTVFGSFGSIILKKMLIFNAG